MKGEVYGRWTVIEAGPPTKGYKKRVFCRCKCGREVLVLYQNLTRGLSNGCRKCSRRYVKNYHGLSNSKTYSVYIQMIERCHNESHPSYNNYGARGIHVCQKWKESFLNFIEDMGEAPDGLSIERINNNKGYFKSNCRWANWVDQCRNKRNSIQIGEVCNGWVILRRGERKKTYWIRCSHCMRERCIQSCNFRRVVKCKCTMENY
jgi:hypothetical protein